MRNSHGLVALGIAIVLSAFATNQYNCQESVKSQRVLRPPLVASTDPCVVVSQPGSYLVPKGSLIEIDWMPTGASGCMGYGVNYGTTLNGVLERVKRLGIWGLVLDSYGTNGGEAWFVRAMKTGNDTITMTINGTDYVYSIQVY